MTPNEFKAWLEGYMAAGGKDAEVIAKKAKEIYEAAPVSVPSYRPPTYQPYVGSRDDMTVPVEWHHFPSPPLPYTTCNSEVTQ